MTMDQGEEAQKDLQEIARFLEEEAEEERRKTREQRVARRQEERLPMPPRPETLVDPTTGLVQTFPTPEESSKATEIGEAIEEGKRRIRQGDKVTIEWLIDNLALDEFDANEVLTFLTRWVRTDYAKEAKEGALPGEAETPTSKIEELRARQIFSGMSDRELETYIRNLEDLAFRTPDQQKELRVGKTERSRRRPSLGERFRIAGRKRQSQLAEEAVQKLVGPVRRGALVKGTESLLKGISKRPKEIAKEQEGEGEVYSSFMGPSWSVGPDDGINRLDPRYNPYTNSLDIPGISALGSLEGPDGEDGFKLNWGGEDIDWFPENQELLR